VKSRPRTWCRSSALSSSVTSSAGQAAWSSATSFSFLSGGDGDDVIDGRGDSAARDLVNCGTGVDTAILHWNDQFYAGCAKNVTAAEAGCEHLSRERPELQRAPTSGPLQPAP
jgi:hypothetical protein